MEHRGNVFCLIVAVNALTHTFSLSCSLHSLVEFVENKTHVCVLSSELRKKTLAARNVVHPWKQCFSKLQFSLKFTQRQKKYIIEDKNRFLGQIQIGIKTAQLLTVVRM